MQKKIIAVSIVLLWVTACISQDFSSPSKTKNDTAAVTTTFSNNISASDACAKAHAAVGGNINKPLWFTVGCLTGCVGVLIAYAVEPSPPVLDLIGKDSDYILMYRDCYVREGKKKQLVTALIGCGTCAAAYVAYYIILFAAFSR